MTPKLADFKRILMQRSNENTKSIRLLHEQELFGTCISLLRQELDSLIRVCYLHTLTNDLELNKLIEDTVNGVEWRKNGERITDRKMVNIASQYNHWAPEVYNFGNCFTHLTNYHDYEQNDPLLTLDLELTQKIRNYLNSYHGFPLTSEVNFQNVIPYIPEVALKISNNLRLYIDHLNSRQ
ncbi:hypothetical protein BWI97_00865 [Siphonobacter sp. BAB-5405]|uniref:hypothetical protein n=1 Tax=Siphonobacter sp. BAB-5405 TaxID=1864825 RepID=UPI000C80FC95|nr:hypothetical protein [Siphonobacter sp. BAB-5405]PMD99537.1 hypothetical protein BWI97_00865 [Siphonobacter sp. BAB-5405]